MYTSISLLKHVISGLDQHTIYLIGPPGVGKSTWIKTNGEGYVIASSDDVVDAYAAEHGMTYSEAWPLCVKHAEKQTMENYKEAVAAGKNIIIDRTNMTMKVRNKFHSNTPKTYKKLAVVFSVEREELNRRLTQRPGKVIPSFVVDGMLASYQEPTTAEFDYIFV